MLLLSLSPPTWHKPAYEALHVVPLGLNEYSSAIPQASAPAQIALEFSEEYFSWALSVINGSDRTAETRARWACSQNTQER